MSIIPVNGLVALSDAATRRYVVISVPGDRPRHHGLGRERVLAGRCEQPVTWACGVAADLGRRRAWDSGSHSPACALMLLLLLLSWCFPSSSDQALLSLLLPFSSAGVAYDIGWMGWSMATLRQRRSSSSASRNSRQRHRSPAVAA
jgi:hypothetical protein